MFGTDNQFHEMVPNSDDFVVTFESGMKWGLEGKTRDQTHHDSN
jgi:hypothetical protein